MATQSLRQVRERELVLATRALFDERGVQHAPIEEIAKGCGRRARGVPELFTVAGDDVVRTCVESALALVRARC
jgi:hypothetical protein